MEFIEWSILKLILVFLLGLNIGSFLNVVILRTQSGRGGILTGRSECPHCGHPLHWGDLIPILSWLWQRGKCRYCAEAISGQYPLVESLTAILFLIHYLVVGNDSWRLWSGWLFIAIMIIVAIYDLRFMEIPWIGDFWEKWLKKWGVLKKVKKLPELWRRMAYWLLALVMVPVYWPTLVALVGNVWWSGGNWQLYGAGFLVYVLFFSLIILTGIIFFPKQKQGLMGLGDLYIGGFLGVLLGWKLSLVALFIAFVGGSVIGVIWLIVHQHRRLKNHQLPFAPFLIGGGLVAWWFGTNWLNWYLTMLNY